MRKLLTAGALSLVAVTLAITVTACGSSKKSSKSSIQVCALLPDTTTSVRYELFDKPFLAAAFKKAGISYSILNALGDPQKQKSQGNQCLTNGAKVILVDALDSGTGASIENAADAKGVQTIDYDRLVLNGKASYYVSFDNVKVGELMGNGIVAALKASGEYSKTPVVAELNGAPTDNNAKLFAQGYDSVLDPLYADGTFKKGPNQSVPDWDNQKALTIFEQMLVQTGNKINAVAAANDGLANAVITALKNHKLSPIPVSGQDATPQGVQNILAGWQSGTVYKAVKAEAAAAADVAIKLINNETVKTNGAVNNGVRDVPSVLLTPVWVTKANYTVLFTDKFLKKSEVCVGAYAKYC